MLQNVYSALLQAWSVANTTSANSYGVEIAIVTNVKDPEKRGRVKICFPRLPGKPESDWARVCQPSAGGGRGFYWLPEVSDEVLVAFERGQSSLPYVIGALWNGKDKPMKDAYTDENTTRMIQTKSGHQIVFNDKSGEEKIIIGDKSGKRTLTFDVKEKKFLVEAGIGDVEIHAKKKILLLCEDLEIKTKKTGKFDVGSKFDLKVAGKLGFKAGPQINLKASKVNLNPPSLSLEDIVKAIAAALGGPAAAAAAAAAVAAAEAAAGGAAGGGAAGGGDLARNAGGAAAGAAAGAAGAGGTDAAGKAGAAGPDGADWTKAKDGAGGAAGGAGAAGAAGGPGAAGGGATGVVDSTNAPPGPNDINVDVTDSAGKPAAGVDWKITLADGTVNSGTTGSDGKISVRGLKAATDYTLVFPAAEPGGAAAGAGADGGDAKKDEPPKAAGDGPILRHDDPRLSAVRKKLLKEAEMRIPSIESKKDNDPPPGRMNLFSGTVHTAGTSCGLLPGVLMRKIGVKGPIGACGTEGVRMEAQKMGIAVQNDGTTLPKPGDIYWLRYPEKDEEDGVAHVGVIYDINVTDPVAGEVWITADSGQGTMENQEAQFVKRQMKKKDGTHFFLSGPKNTPGDSPFLRRIGGWLDLDKLDEKKA